MARESPAELLAAAQQQLAAARFVEAELLCRAVLQRRSDEPEAYRLLALIAHFSGLPNQALPLLQQALRIDPASHYAYDNLSAVLMSLGRPAEAETASRRAVAQHPDEGRFWCNLAVALEAQSRSAEAEECYRRAWNLEPELFEAARNLGRLLVDAGRYAEAADVCRQAVRLNSQSVAAQTTLGSALAGQGQVDEALRCYRQALEIDPQHLAALCGLGQLLLATGQAQSAEGALRQALQTQPDQPQILFLLGRAMQLQGALEDAEDQFRRLLKLQTPAPETLSALAGCLHAQGRTAEAADVCRQALVLAPAAAAIHSQLLFIEQYRPGVTAATLAALHAQWEVQHAPAGSVLWSDDGRSRDAERPLRVGFVSADFVQHPVGRLFAALVEKLDRRQCQVYCYQQGAGRDALTTHIEKSAAWCEIAALTDQQLASRIRADQIDVLFDLSGHTPGNRLPVFARKPAPLQVTWLGYVGTTGLGAMDYLLADAWHVPRAEETYYRERVLRMPDDYLCYAPPADAPEVNSLPAQVQGHVTFGCFSQLAKFSEPCVALFAEVLRRVPGSRLLLKYAGADGPRTRKRLTAAFAAAGIERGRLEFSGGGRTALFLRHYQQVDLCLDPFPYSGGLTTCDALWMGVPVVTLPGATFAGRHALSHLTAVGLTATLARDAEHYVELAAAWAADRARLADYRARLRAQMAASPLCDMAGFAAHFQKLLRAIWRGWVHTETVPPLVSAATRSLE